MKANEYIYLNRKKFLISSLFLIILGIVISYFNYGTEPWETVGGFTCGLGFGLILIFIGIKSPKTNDN
ncbi:hypothetical protein [Winogradskyella ursingii]|uniref:hypothetical protein n=1 Tax=Winogradskyella ursingii TaxID=2686079 RepID=UPI0015CB2D3D|nr:hypothetical protein [Winogradskyella ursingii]